MEQMTWKPVLISGTIFQLTLILPSGSPPPGGAPPATNQVPGSSSHLRYFVDAVVGPPAAYSMVASVHGNAPTPIAPQPFSVFSFPLTKPNQTFSVQVISIEILTPKLTGN